MMMINGTRTFMILLYKKFWSACVHFAPSAASRFLLIVSTLLLSARSNLSALTTSNVHVHILLLAISPTEVVPKRLGVMVHTIVFLPTASVKIGFILMLTQSLPQVTILNSCRMLELYTFIFCSDRLQLRNPAGIFVPIC